MIPLSASMIIRNEEATLERALTTLKRLPMLEEIVIIDTGSTDRSIQIARDLGALVHEETWQNDFSHHRNHCLDLCRNPWVFILDGDEELVDPGDLPLIFEEPRREGYWVHVECRYLAKPISESVASLRVFDKRVGRWRYPIHNQVVGVKDCAPSSARLIAYYDEGSVDAIERRLEILFKHQRENPEDPHYPLYIAKSYRALGQSAQVVEWANEYFDAAEDGPLAAMVCSWMIEAKLALGHEEEAATILDLALKRYPTFPDLRFLQMALAAAVWFRTSRHPDPRFLTASIYSRHLIERLPDAAELLQLPLEFREAPVTTLGDDAAQDC